MRSFGWGGQQQAGIGGCLVHRRSGHGAGTACAKGRREPKRPALRRESPMNRSLLTLALTGCRAALAAAVKADGYIDPLGWDRATVHD